jgi:hypothetical protein
MTTINAPQMIALAFLKRHLPLRTLPSTKYRFFIKKNIPVGCHIPKGAAEMISIHLS